jgi:hypothetical protein
LVLGNRENVVERVLRGQIASDPRPGLTEVRRLEDERIALVDEVCVDGNVRGARLEVRGIDL